MARVDPEESHQLNQGSALRTQEQVKINISVQALAFATYYVCFDSYSPTTCSCRHDASILSMLYPYLTWPSTSAQWYCPICLHTQADQTRTIKPKSNTTERHEEYSRRNTNVPWISTCRSPRSGLKLCSGWLCSALKPQGLLV